VWLCVAASIIGAIASLSMWRLEVESGSAVVTPSSA
jgi:hypothetical protein